MNIYSWNGDQERTQKPLKKAREEDTSRANKYEDWGEACAQGNNDLVLILVGVVRRLARGAIPQSLAYS